MLGKLFAQEMRALWKPAAIMLAVMVVAGVVGIGCIEATDAVSRAAGFASRYVNEASAASNLTVVFVMAALFCGFLVWASLVAVYVFIAMRFYRTMFTDEGYLTLTLPVRAGTLVAAKFWAAFLLAAVFTLMACALASLAMLAITDGWGHGVGGAVAFGRLVGADGQRRGGLVDHGRGECPRVRRLHRGAGVPLADAGRLVGAAA